MHLCIIVNFHWPKGSYKVVSTTNVFIINEMPYLTQSKLPFGDSIILAWIF